MCDSVSVCEQGLKVSWQNVCIWDDVTNKWCVRVTKCICLFVSVCVFSSRHDSCWHAASPRDLCNNARMQNACVCVCVCVCVCAHASLNSLLGARQSARIKLENQSTQRKRSNAWTDFQIPLFLSNTYTHTHTHTHMEEHNLVPVSEPWCEEKSQSDHNWLWLSVPFSLYRSVTPREGCLDLESAAGKQTDGCLTHTHTHTYVHTHTRTHTHTHTHTRAHMLINDVQNKWSEWMKCCRNR